MKNELISIVAAIFLLFTLSSCGEDASSLTDPSPSTIVTDIELGYDASEGSQNGVNASQKTTKIPELKAMDLAIVKKYNDGSKSTMSQSEMANEIAWGLNTNDNLELVVDSGTGTVRVSGTGAAELVATYQPTNDNGNQHITSNPISITIVETILEKIVVQPAAEYAVSCDDANTPSSELVEGCLMQFEVVGYYDNDSTADLSAEAIWTSEKETKAIFISDVDYTIDKTWIDEVKWFIDEEAKKDNDLSNRAGLVLGKSTGEFEISAAFGGLNDTSDPVMIIGPEIHSIGLEVNTFGTNICYEDCPLYENVTVKLEAVGIYTNNEKADVTSLTTITSDADPAYIGIGTTTNSQTGQTIYTGVINVKYGAPEEVTFTVRADDTVKTIDCSVTEEKLTSLERTQPRDESSDVYSLSNRSNVFSFRGIYNNDGYELLEDSERLKLLNLGATWTLSHNEVAEIDHTTNWDDNWADLKGIKVTTKDVSEGSTTVVADTTHGLSVDWTLTIDNSTSSPSSLSISPGNGASHEIEAGVSTQFSGMVIYNNQTSAILEAGEVTWSSDPETCFVGDATQDCITSNGVLTTYNDVEVMAAIPDTDVDASINVAVNDTELVSISVVPDNHTIYENEIRHFHAIGLFSNHRSHLLADDFVNWSTGPGCCASINNNNGILTASSDGILTVTATSLGNDGAWQGVAIDAGITGTTDLTIASLPKISVSGPIASISEVGNPSVTITFKADATFDGDMTIPFEVKGTSVCGEDHDLSSGNAVISTGFTSKEVVFNLINDDLYEEDETIKIVIQDEIVNAKKADTSTDVEVTITSEETPPVLTLPSDSTGDEDVGTIPLVFSIAPISGAAITIELSVSGTVVDSDYTLASNSIEIPIGEEKATLEVDISSDSRKEGDETMLVTVNTNAVIIGDSSFTIIIFDDDTLKFFDTPYVLTCTASSFCDYTPSHNSDGSLTLNFWGLGLPDGLNVDSNTGKISGTPTSDGTADSYICVKDENDPSDLTCAPIDITVLPP